MMTEPRQPDNVVNLAKRKRPKQEISLAAVKYLEEEYGYDQKVLVHEAALMYARAGILVVPLRESTDKKSKALPPKSTGMNYNSASSKEETVARWFDPKTGKFAGHNIGIATGKKKGSAVLDIDVKKGKDGNAALATLLKEKGAFMPTGPTQKTPSGGRHHFFQWAEGITSGGDKHGPGLDVRGGREASVGGHVVVWPSIVDGERYQWERGGNRPPVPLFMLSSDIPGNGTVLTSSQAIESGERRGVDVGDQEQLVPLDQLRRMLDAIEPNNLTYDEWLQVGQAIHTQYPGDEGYSTWDAWSRTGARYESKECHVRWKGFSSDGSIRMGTLFHIAKGAGYRDDPEDKHLGPYDELMAEFNSKYAIVTIGDTMRFLNRKNLTPEERKDPTNKSYDLLTKASFSILTAPKRIETEKGQMVPFANVWVNSPHRKEYPNGTCYVPARYGETPKVPDTKFNVWGGWPYDPTPGNCDPILEHIREVICSGNEEHYEWVLDWCAYSVQEPNSLIHSCIVMRGDEGVGKGILADNCMGRLFGNGYFHLSNEAQLSGKFNAHLAIANYVFADELTVNRRAQGQYKALVTEKYLVTERKGIDSESHRNIIRLIIASNNDFVVPAGAGSRRWMVVDVSSKRKGDRAYFQTLVDHISNGGREHFFQFLLDREITNNLRYPPDTDALKVQRARTNNSHVNDFVLHLIYSGKCLFDEDKIGDQSASGKPYWSNLYLKEMYAEWMEVKKRTVGPWDHELKPDAIGRAIRKVIDGAIPGMMPGTRATQAKVARPDRRGSSVNTLVHYLPSSPDELGATVVALSDISLDEVELPGEWERDEEYWRPVM